MTLRFAAAALALLAAVPLCAATPPRPAKPPASLPVPAKIVPADVERVAMTTELGTIVIDLDGKRAPLSTANFLRYVVGKRFDNMVFYRVMRLAWGEQPNGLVQAGLRGDPTRVLPPIPHESTATTGLKHVAGAISMARLGVGTATADFSILISDIPGLDAGQNPNDPEGYAVFGRVVEGLDVARKIYDVPLSPTAGSGVLKGQMIEKPVKVLTVRRVKVPVPPTVVAPQPPSATF
ncbi:peptidylprolyl isomerase [Sphingomonas sp. SUN039]|uniref:peptidylprolyl isomerase n=1 Tax=Sphingomonas sp. SUN039 TaxID=2937787 RepID=UPI0021647F1E|nr:peptidylprolyl isomerase [Sphingomonas sp. SUN039]UVO55488.1 peptidylprolyl isomerase [Sphingomonas sp. SUN039]